MKTALRYLVWGKKTPRRFVFGVGLYTIFYPVYDMVKAPVLHNAREPLPLKSRYGLGNYAVVAGATSSTGEAFCDKLASQGFKLILVDDTDNEAALNKLSEKYSTAPVFTFDFKHQTTWQEYEALCTAIQEKAGGESKQNNIAILVNGIEGFDPRKGKIHKASDEELLVTTNLNSFPQIMMNRFLGPQMLAWGTHKSGIINMTSYYADWPSYNLPLYAAGKAMQAHASYILGLEVEDEMDVLTVKQLPVKSERNPLGVDAKDVVEGVLHDLGQERISYGHWKHSLYRYPILMQQCQWWYPVSKRAKPQSDFKKLLGRH